MEALLRKLPDPSSPAIQRKRRATPRTAKQIKGDQAQQLIAAYKAGASVYELGRRFGISRQTVGDILKRHNVKTRFRKFTDEQVDVAVQLYEQGLSLARVGERLNVTGDTIRAHLLKRGVKMRDAHGRER
ncbi:helix-turn-helix domain-containing protein [Streptomyces sp. NPDC006996]|uniref:helix-turn-helix domain-containing protein n=1 Tax=Streptomyces sp. NPDC006996 TaxID=3156908 RepID=UPI0033FB87FE